MQPTEFNTSLQEGGHAHLQKMTGNWKGVARTWFEPDKLADESLMQGTIRSVLGGRYLVHEYTGSMGNTPLEGIIIYGYHIPSGTFQQAWIDSVHTGLEVLFSESTPKSEAMNMKTTYWAGEGEPRWGWRTHIELRSQDELVITAYNDVPGLGEVKAMEIVYQRIG